MSGERALSGWLLRTLLLQFAAIMPLQGVRPMVSYRALELGAGPVALGLVAASYAVLSFAIAVPLGRWVDRLGEPRFLLLGATTLVACSAALATVGDLPTLIGVYALLGLGHVTTLIALQTLVANGGPAHQRDARFGAFTVVASTGHLVGPAAAGFVFEASGESLDRVFLAAAGVILVAMAVAASIWIRPPRLHERRGGARSEGRMLATVGTVLRQPSVPHAMVASLTVICAIDLITAYLPAYGEANQIPVAVVGVLLSVRAGASIVSRVLMLPLLRALGRQRLLVLSMLLPTVALVALPTTAAPIALGVVLAVAGFGLGLGQPLSLVWVTEQVPVDIRGTAIGVRLTGNRFGQLTVPVVVGAVAGAAGIGAIFVASAAMLGLGSLLVSRAPRTTSTATET